MSDPRRPDSLIESALTAWRPRTPDGRILAHPAWADMTVQDRKLLFEESLATRRLEQASDDRRLSTTARGILNRIINSQ